MDHIADYKELLTLQRKPDFAMAINIYREVVRTI